MADGRVLVALDDGPLTASPTWTRLDDTDSFVSGFDIHGGRQTNLDRTDTGTANVYFNDTTGRLDPRNTSSDLYGKIDGKQILLQIYNPVTATWEPQFRGTIDYANFDVNPATNPDGSLVVANVQLECVDMFDYLGGIQMVPGHFGTTPPAGSEGSIYYQPTPDSLIGPTVDARIIEALTDANVDSTRYVVFSGNISMPGTQYDAGDSTLVVCRDAADAELPMIANIYCDRYGRFVFHGRYSRFDPVTTWTGIAGTDAARDAVWRFRQWKAGDGIAIAADSTCAQIRVLSYSRGRRDVINAAVAWPTGMDQADMPGQVYTDTTSISDYGYHGMPAMEDLQILAGTTTGNDAKTECLGYAGLYVENRKNPLERVQTLTVKAIRPDDPRASSTWGLLTEADISDILNLSVGYPGADGVGLQNFDQYIEGYSTRVRPLNPTHDYVERDFDISPAEWSMDTHGIFA